MFNILFLCLLCQVKEISPKQPLDIEIVTRKKDTYYLLVKENPTTITVEGPTYLRIYTRIPWSDDKDKNQVYKLVLTENKIDEQILTFESERSSVTKDGQGRALSKWRSFYIEVPEGTNTYRLQHWSSPVDTILFKIAYESPKSWLDVPATEYRSILETIEEEKIIKYYEMTKTEPVRLIINGPENLKVVVRLNYDNNVFGDQQFNIIVNDNGRINSYSLKCYKSDIITYNNRKNLMPSNAKNLFIKLTGGSHDLSFTLESSAAASAAMRILIEE